MFEQKQDLWFTHIQQRKKNIPAQDFGQTFKCIVKEKVWFNGEGSKEIETGPQKNT